jgi:hypothetical protein
MRYKITIEEYGQEVAIIEKRWVRGAGATPDEYGYAPETEGTQNYQRTIYEQTVENLDMAAVVSVVNGLSK